MTDAVRSPSHYRYGKIEVIDYLREKLGVGFEDYCAGNVIKYISRAGLKGNAAEDYAKAAFYAQMAAHTLEPDKYPDPRAT